MIILIVLACIIILPIIVYINAFTFARGKNDGVINSIENSINHKNGEKNDKKEKR